MTKAGIIVDYIPSFTILALKASVHNVVGSENGSDFILKYVMFTQPRKSTKLLVPSDFSEWLEPCSSFLSCSGV